MADRRQQKFYANEHKEIAMATLVAIGYPD